MKCKIFVLTMLAAFTLAAAENLIVNGSFEEGKVGGSQILPGWTRRTAGNSFKFHSVDRKIAFDGKRSVRITIPDDAPAKSAGYAAQNWIKVAGGKSYKLSFRVRAVKGEARAVLSLFDAQKKFAGLARVKTVKVENGDDWQLCETVYSVTPKIGDGLLVLRLELASPGEVWFDDVRLTALD